MVDIKLEGLRKDFQTPSGSIVAVDSIDLEIEHGEFFSLIGPSGCGKTTTLRMIAGLETPTSGEIYFDDERVTDLSPQKRDIAMIFQDVVLYPHMTNYENIVYGLKVRNEPVDEEKIRELTEYLQISDLMDKNPNQLSGGQQQRVALGRALVREPNVILFDEPLSDLDAKLKADLRVEIQKLHKDFQTTMVYVTHDQKEALTMSSRVGLMNEGDLTQVASPDVIFNSPNTDFVGRFIGQPEMNVVDAEIKESGEICIGDNAIHHIRSPELEKLDSVTTQEIKLGFRPQHSRMVEGPTNGRYAASLEVWETLGDEYILYLTDPVGNEIKIVSDSKPDIDSGREVGVEATGSIYIFDSKTGKTISIIS